MCVLQTDTDKLNDSYAALERKAALYDKLSQGRFDDDEEQYNVDFLQKGLLTHEMLPRDRHRPAHDPAEPIDTSAMAIRASGVPLNLPLYLPCFLQRTSPTFPHSQGLHARFCTVFKCWFHMQRTAVQ